MSSASWNPYNKVVQDEVDGTIDHEATNKVRQELGLATPWNPIIGEFEVGYPAAHLELPGTSGLRAGLYRNKKTGHVYRAYASAVNATNKSDGQVMVQYRDVHEDTNYVREVEEFREKFRKVDL